MAIFGYIVYMACTLFVSFISIGVMTWPGNGGEKWFIGTVVALLWWGAVAWAPFSVVSA